VSRGEGRGWGDRVGSDFDGVEEKEGPGTLRGVEPGLWEEIEVDPHPFGERGGWGQGLATSLVISPNSRNTNTDHSIEELKNLSGRLYAPNGNPHDNPCVGNPPQRLDGTHRWVRRAMGMAKARVRRGSLRDTHGYIGMHHTVGGRRRSRGARPLGKNVGESHP